MKEYLDYMFRQTLLKTQEFMLILSEISSFNMNCSMVSRKVYSMFFQIIFIQEKGPYEKCRLMISDYMSCPMNSPQTSIIDLSFVKISILKSCLRSPLGQVQKSQSNPTRQLPLVRMDCDWSTVLQKLQQRRPYYLKFTFLKEKPKNKAIPARMVPIIMQTINIFHLSFIIIQLFKYYTNQILKCLLQCWLT